MSDLRLLNSYEVFDYTPDMIKESLEKTGKILLKGILQKADTLNQNGRIYPLEILKREIRNYQKFILENRALGELDHPECVSDGYYWLSEHGWLRVEDIQAGMKAATINEFGVLEYQEVERSIHEPYKGKMVKIWNKKGTIEQLLTPNHRILLWDRNNKPYYITALDFHEAVQEKSSKISHSSFRRAATWFGNDIETIQIADKTIDTELWAAFLGIYLAEGHANGIKSLVMQKRKSQRCVVITQYKKKSRDQIRELLQLLPWDFKEIRQGFSICDDALYEMLFSLGASQNKYIPQYAKDWSPRLLQVMLDWLLLGDGRNRYGYKKECIVPEYCTVSKKLAHDVYEIMLKLGTGATIHTYQPADRHSPDFQKNGRMILAKNSLPIHIVYQHSSKSISADTRYVNTELVDYDSIVHCMTTKNSNWLAMSPSGKVFWTGNSSVVNLKNCSHIIRDAHIEDNGIVYGTIEVLDKTPSGAILKGLVESGVKLGISSRGVGSTKKDGDYHVVQDDFQLICWDMVSEPSTPGAFMIPEGKSINPSELKRIFNKTDRIDRVLNDILDLNKM